MHKFCAKCGEPILVKKGKPVPENKGIWKAVILAVAILCVAAASFFGLRELMKPDESTPPAPSPSPSTVITSPSTSPADTPVPTPGEDPPPEEDPPPDPLSHRTLAEAIQSTNNWVRLEIMRGSELRIFERNRYSVVWVRYAEYNDDRLTDPEFLLQADYLSVGFPTTEDRYYLYGDNTGYYGQPGKSSNINVTWSYETDPHYDNGTVSGVYERYDFIGAVANYPMVSLYIDWADGRRTIFYKQRDDRWAISSRSESNFLHIKVNLIPEADWIFMELPEGHRPYYLYYDGGGWFESLNDFTWHYSFSS